MCSGQQGNLTERVTASVISLLMIFAVFVGVLYLLLWQTYVLWLEAVLIMVEMAFLTIEIIFAFITIATFARCLVFILIIVNNMIFSVIEEVCDNFTS